MYKPKIPLFFCLSVFLFLFYSSLRKINANPWNIKEYEKDYLEKGYTKFSDFIAKLKADKQYRYVEDFFELYRFPHLYGEKNMLKNIANLRYALTLKFRSPYQALCKILDKKDYHKYRLLIFMHINILLTRNFLRIGAFYDKRHVHFHDIAYAKELSKSFELAKSWYKAALPYWKTAKKYAYEANRIKRDLGAGVDTMETERFDIVNGKLNFGRMAKIYMSRLRKKKQKIDRMMQLAK